MRLNTPSFWYVKYHPKALLLSPFSLLYRAGHFLHQKLARSYEAKMPVICVGNLIAGGSGKTPTALALMQIVRNKALADSPCFLTRGYGGTEKGPFPVNKDDHTSRQVGDEPLLLAERARTVIAADRKAGAQYAEKQNHDLIIMDDGFQNPGLKKDLNFIVIDGLTGFGNGQMIPAGPLRQSLRRGFKKADAFILLGEDIRNIAAKLPADKPLFRGTLQIKESWIIGESIDYIAFSGLARPGKFRRTLEGARLNIVGWHPFPDHYEFAPEDLEKLSGEAAEKEARLITTAKDAVRLPAEFLKNNKVDILPVEIKWNDEDALVAYLQSNIETLHTAKREEMKAAQAEAEAQAAAEKEDEENAQNTEPEK